MEEVAVISPREPARDRGAGDGSNAAVARALRGDREALAAVWRQHRRWVAAVLLTYKPPYAELDDLLQEVAATLVSKITTVRDEANLRAWLRTVAINAARASARSSRRRPAVLPLANDGRTQSIEIGERAALGEEARLVLEAALGLPEHYREPLVLRAVHHLRTRQIAEILGIPEATVDTRVARARRMLREHLAGSDELCEELTSPSGQRTRSKGTA
jgi:RNA polymerase sigma-70 factor (ECF subfamily)